MYKLAAFRNKLGARGRDEANARIAVIDMQLQRWKDLISVAPQSDELDKDYLAKTNALKAERDELQKKLQ